MSTITYREAIVRAQREALAADPRVILMGEDIGAAGGPFKTTEGLFEEFGPLRVRDTPISENAFVGAAMGMALTGYRPVIELMFADFMGVCFDQIVNGIAKHRFMCGGKVAVPVTIRAMGGGGVRFGAQHSQTGETWVYQFPGLKVFCPASPADAYLMLRQAIDDPDPVIVLEHKAMMAMKGEIQTDAGHWPAQRPQVVGRDGTSRWSRRWPWSDARWPPRMRSRRRGSRRRSSTCGSCARWWRSRSSRASPVPGRSWSSRRTTRAAAGAPRSSHARSPRPSTTLTSRRSASRYPTGRCRTARPSRTRPCRPSRRSSTRCSRRTEYCPGKTMAESGTTTPPFAGIAGRSALVTGAAGGIGRAIVAALVAEGVQVLATDLNEAALESLRDSPAGRAQVAVLAGDLSRLEEPERLVSHAVALHGGIDILVNNAGCIIRRDFREADTREWELMVSVNLRAAFFLAQRAAASMTARGWGRIVNLTSQAGHTGGAADCPIYAITKGG
jgi:hypothetical protein